MKQISKKLAGFTSAIVVLASLSFAAVKTNEKAPDFTLTDINGMSHSLSANKGKYVVLEWINHGCPFVKKHYESGNMQSLQKQWGEKGVVWLSVASSAQGKEGYMDAAEWKKAIETHKSTATAVLLDTDGKVGKLYGAKTTPHMYVINPEGVLIYQGAIDDKASADKADIKGATNYVSAALTEAMAGKKVTTPTTKSYGCSVKY
jgi:peroxiredoxin